MYRRNIKSRIEAALADTRVVLLNGARQTGKSTLAASIAESLGGSYLTLDDATTLGVARRDPVAFVHANNRLTVIDEVQHAPELFPAIKREVDVNRTPGRFLLTGSANVLLLPRIAESLAGRVEILALHPLSQDEIGGRTTDFPAVLFSDAPLSHKHRRTIRSAVASRMIAGGYPEAVDRTIPERRAAWHRSYLTTVLHRDIRDLSNIEGLTELPRLVGLLASRTAGLMNMAEVARSAGLTHTSIRRYLALLEATFIVQPLQAWSSNIGKRFVRAPKIHLVDTGLVAHLRGETDPERLALSASLGPLLESFVVQEIRTQLSWSTHAATAYHLRTSTGQEVDLLLEAPGGTLVGVEVKAASTVNRSDVTGLETLREMVGKKFIRGVVLYLGDTLIPLGDRLWAMPVSALWSGGE